MSAELNEEIRDLYDQGYSMHAIGRKLGCSSACVHGRLKRLGVKSRPSGGGHSAHYRTPQRTMYLTIGLYKSGYSKREVAELLGVSVSTVSWRLMMMGVQARSLSEGQKLAWRSGHRRRRASETQRNIVARRSRDQRGTFVAEAA